MADMVHLDENLVGSWKQASDLLLRFRTNLYGSHACHEVQRPIGLDHFFTLCLLGAVAQLGERLICIQEVAGSIPTSSTSGSLRMGSYRPKGARWACSSAG